MICTEINPYILHCLPLPVAFFLALFCFSEYSIRNPNIIIRKEQPMFILEILKAVLFGIV